MLCGSVYHLLNGNGLSCQPVKVIVGNVNVVFYPPQGDWISSGENRDGGRQVSPKFSRVSVLSFWLVVS